MTIALLGPSGAGKGTQANHLVQHFDWLHISTGDLFRQCSERRTALGLLAKRYMNRGDLVPDEVADALIEEWLSKATPGQDILFDGFPRTRYQAEFLDRRFAELGRTLNAVVYLKVSDQEIIKRLQGRIICRCCQTPYHLTFNPPVQANICDFCSGPLDRRIDDTPEIVRARLKRSHREMAPLVDYYQTQGKLIIVDGHGSIEKVGNSLTTIVMSVARHQVRTASRAETNRIQALKNGGPVRPRAAIPATKNLVLFGPPGSGKGTQATQLNKRFRLPHIASGDLFRENLKNKTELGILARTYMERGELVPDDVTLATVGDRLERPDTRRGFILDGFPRTMTQAEALAEITAKLGRPLTAVIYVKVPDEQIVTRLSGRRICRNCQTPYHVIFKPPAQIDRCDACDGNLYQRSDDNPKTINARLATFHGQTAPVIDYYKKLGLLVEVNGQGQVLDITHRIFRAVEQLSQPNQNPTPLSSPVVEPVGLGLGGAWGDA